MKLQCNLHFIGRCFATINLPISLILIKLEWLGYHMIKKLTMCQAVFIEYRNAMGQTDRQTDGHNCYINIARQYAHVRQKPSKNNALPKFHCPPSYHGLARYSVQSLDWCCSASASALRAAPCMSEQRSWTFPCESELQQTLKPQSRLWHSCQLSPLNSHICQTTTRIDAEIHKLFSNNSQ